jgi:hypothetical protein
MQPKSRRIGRPTTKGIEGQKATLGIRASADLKSRLDEAAKRNGRSLSAEAETRLELSFHTEVALADGQRIGFELAYGTDGAELMHMLGRIISGAPRTFAAPWMRSPTAFGLIGRRIAYLLEQLQPTGDPVEIPDERVQEPVNRLLAALGKIPPPPERKEAIGQ